ncbi:TolC family protein [Lysobacter cavernae]|uniref:TolC family protein n=1 Tax=Lysobacter cavernae TaxID=1685901 RepID=A0ABV7RT43_9GAMM
MAWPVFAQEPLSFDDALLRLQQRNEKLAAAGHAVDQARAEAGVARSRRWPTLNVEAQALRWDDPLVLEFSDTQISLPDLPIALPPLPLPTTRLEIDRQDYRSVLATAKQPLYAGGRIQAGIRAADAAVAAAQAQQLGEQGGLMLELVQRYFGQRLADQAVLVRQATRDSLGRHLDDARKLEREGQIARAERLRAEVAWAEAQRELGDAQRQAEMARSALAVLLASEQGFDPSTPIPQAPAPQSLAQLKQRALESNPQLTRVAQERVRAEQGVRAVRGEFAPTIGLLALSRLYSRDPILQEPDWAIGVSLDWPLFDGFQRNHKLQGARAQLDRVESLQAAGRRDVELLVEQRHQQLLNAHEQLQSYQTTRALAEESLRAQRIAFAEGFATSLDVVDAELALSRLRLGILSTRYQAVVAQAGLYEASGESGRIREFVRAAPAAEGDGDVH